MSPEELEAVSLEDAVFERLQDLYVQEGIDGVLGALSDLRSVGGCRALVDLGVDIRFSDPDGSAACVVCADLLASRLEPGELGERELEDFRCKTALELGWSWLELGRIDDAEAALARAAERYCKGTRGPVIEAKLLDTWAVLHAKRRDWDKARQAARAALARYEQAGERHYQGRMLYRLSLIEERGGGDRKTEESLRCASEALARLDAETEPDLYNRAVNQQVGCLVELERYREARIRLFESQGHYHRHGDAMDELQRAVLAGLSNARLGKLYAAKRELITALYVLCAVGDTHMFGLLALELCAVYFIEGFDAEVRTAALKIIPVFHCQPLPAGGRKALLRLEMALEDDLADADLLRRTARYLRELQHDPDARFHPSS